MRNETIPRIMPLPPGSERLKQVVPLAAKGANGTNVISTMLRNEELYDVWRPLARYLNGNSRIARREREIIILRTAWLGTCEYIFGNHVLVARDAGLSEEEISATKTDATAAIWQFEDAILMSAVDELVSLSTLSDQTWSRLADRYDELEIIEVVMLVGHYIMMSCIVNSLGISREQGVPGFEAEVDLNVELPRV